MPADASAAFNAYDRVPDHSPDRDRVRHWMIGSSVVFGIVVLLGGLGLGMMWLPLKLGRAGVPAAQAQVPQARAVDARLVDTRARDTRTSDTRAETNLAGPAVRPKAAPQSAAITVPAVPESPDVSMAELRAWAQPMPGGLSAAEIREVQGRLLTLGFNPGRIDGAAGPNTKSAARLYRERRGFLPANGTIDTNLLTALRQDPGPRVAQRPQRSRDPFEPIVKWWRSL
jgi:hypothetical protein